MNMRQLQYFLAVAAELNFTRASERVNIAQPALSAQIISLEDELGTALFTREKRKVMLTPAGEILVEHAQRVLNTASAAIAAVRASGRGAHAHLIVGSIYTAIYCFLPNTLRLFNALAPNSDVSLQEMTIPQQIAGLKEGLIEVGLVRGHIYDHNIVTELLYRELLVVAVPAGSEFDVPGPVELRELAQWPLIAVARGTATERGYGDKILDIFEDADLHPTIAKEAYDMHTSACLVAAGVGVAVVPAVMQLMQPHGVAYRPLAVDTASVSLSLAWHKDRVPPLLSAWREASRTNAMQLIAKHPQFFVDTPALHLVESAAA
ncbi:LysR family transcriptional regulator [Burkholderia multivorans]|uniref:LysR substrate-binding domain-containing protein n=1 Tax=Burkholderia multivorans TaxID=87883 RepID=UPI001999B57B|nr:LysR substrate-binding domain-containing protein [Burkholderia multivorans]MBU9669206.1 LysR family transcriptional regulator [Burkholderia multivorans]CAB5301188.1 LysR family transcriptional regulator [Burkholderia multivorans]CAB5305357.1 LysR family transcriptional regulator [Burkholderia multivorans]CAB5310689.1 LysR family transcriptional regulator [Burkholderia multivorans]CAB5312527.1 LysR family transcriptional regulator [Burkholderia multivorans]